jgi:hypothetical protein
LITMGVTAASSAAGRKSASSASSTTLTACVPRRNSPAQRTSGTVIAMVTAAASSAGPISRRGSTRSAIQPPLHAPYAIAASATPMTALLVCSVTPTYGPTSRSPTISSTSTAPLA